MDVEAAKRRARLAAREAENVNLCVGVAAIVVGIGVALMFGGILAGLVLLCLCCAIFWITKTTLH